MRICHVIESAAAGSGQVVTDLSQYGAEGGDDITVICGSQRVEKKFIESISAINGITLVIAPMRREIGLRDLADGWNLLRALRRHGPFDIIHGHSSKAGALVRIAGIFIRKPAKVYTAHGFITQEPASSPVYRRIEKLLSWFCDAVIAVSEGEKRHALALGINPAKVKLIPNGTNIKAQLPREQARKELGIGLDETALGFVGRMQSPKNPMMAIEAFALAAKHYPDLNLYMIGEGPLLNGVRESVQSHNLQDKVHLLGFRNGRNLMAAFDALVCSSDSETLPITFLEALNAGTPIVTRCVNGTEETIVEGKTGFLATSNAPEGLAEAIMNFAAATPEQREQMHKHTREHSRLFTQESMGKANHELYKTLLTRKSAKA